MTDANAFLRSILEHPDDDAPRLVYADWLEERDDPRGEFIRVQCELAGKADDDPRRIELEVREWQLLTAGEDDWVGPLSDWLDAWQFKRGFIEEATLSAVSFLAHADELYLRAPVRGIRLLEAADHVHDLADSPHLARLTRLDLSGNALGNRGAQVLAVSPHLASLTALNLRGNDLDAAGVQALAGTPHLARLAVLDLSGNPIGPASLQIVALSPHLGRHAPLVLHYDPIDVEARESLQTRFGERLEFRG